MVSATAAAALLGYLPGALVFRLPIAHRERRAALDAAERAFWAVMISLALSLSGGLALALLDRYSLGTLLWIDGSVSAVIVILVQRHLLCDGTAPAPNWWTLVPLALIVLGVWQFFPTSEYIIGGKDPGTYFNEGIQIAQRGAIIVRDPVIAALPPATRDLFIPAHDPNIYGLRFMGFYITNLDAGTVIGQFPHVFPVSLAIGYGLNGLTGARDAVAVWAILGLLAVYFASARLIGRPAAAAAATLLALNVIQVWFARYPNSEVLMQALLFAGLLAFARAHQDNDRFFAPISAWLIGLLLFQRPEMPIALVALLAAAALAFVVDRRATLRLSFIVPMVAAAVLAWFYLTGPLIAYAAGPLVYFASRPAAEIAGTGGALIVCGALLLWLRLRHAALIRSTVPVLLILVTLGLAIYAWQFRQPGGKLTDYDAYALRNFVNFYLFTPGMLAALLGLVIIVRRDFWRDPALLLTIIAFACVLFYKIRIVPEHFWMTRRFLPVILPGAMIFIAAAAGATWYGPLNGWRRLRPLVGVVFLLLLAGSYVHASAPIVSHVEYAGVIPYLERLAKHFGDRDLVIVESRDAGSDVHVLATPLADIYAKNVLVLSSPKPDKAMLQIFLQDAQTKYDHVYFLGGGGTDLLSRHIVAEAVSGEKIQVPEYESSWTYPQGVRMKEFDYGIYRLTLGTVVNNTFTLDLGNRDDLNVVRFNAKEATEGRTMRWTGRQSFVEIPGLTASVREVVLTMHDGGRPANATPARVQVFFDNVDLGTIDVKNGFQSYRLAIPADAAARAAATDAPAELKLISTTWNPHTLIGAPDTRDLGVMLSRVEVR